MTTQQLQLKLQKQAHLQQCLNQSVSPQGSATVASSPASETTNTSLSGSAVVAALLGKHRRRSATDVNK